MEKEFLLHYVTSVDIKHWNKITWIGSYFCVLMKEDTVVLGIPGDIDTLYPGFRDCPIRDLYQKVDSKWTKQREYLYAMVTKVFPSFWSDLCICLNNEWSINLDILDVNTPKDIINVSYRDGYILIYTKSIQEPIIYSVKRLPPEAEILQRIKTLFMQ